MNGSAEVTKQRRLTLADAFFLVAALAIGFWVSRNGLINWLNVLFKGFNRQAWSSRPIFLSWHWGTLILRHTQPVAAILTLAALGLRIAHPRPTFQRLAQHPGFVACLAASLAICVGGTLNFATSKLSPSPGYELQNHLNGAFVQLGSETGLAILACWTILALSGNWCSDRSWLDGFGKISGLYWIAMMVIARFAPLPY
jgi:hypothetical protein